VSEAIVHHQPISTEELSLTVMTAAVRREHVAAALASFALAGIEPRQLAAGAASLDGLVPLLAVLQTGASVMLVDLGDETTDVCIIKDGRTALARTISVGMGSIRGGEPGAADELAGSLRRTVASYRMKGGTALDRVVVGGEGASEPATRDWLSGVLGCSAETVALPAGDGMILEHELPRFMRVAALAGRAAAKGQRINLRQGEFVSRHAAGEIRHYARLLSLAAAAILASFAISLYTRYTVLDTERAELRAELSAMTHSMFRQRTEDPAQARRLVVGRRGGARPDAAHGRVPRDGRHRRAHPGRRRAHHTSPDHRVRRRGAQRRARDPRHRQQRHAARRHRGRARGARVLLRSDAGRDQLAQRDPVLPHRGGDPLPRRPTRTRGSQRRCREAQQWHSVMH
jgi:hypothetical protein